LSTPLFLRVFCFCRINCVIRSLAKPYKLFLRILVKAVRVTNSDGVLAENVFSQQLAFAFTSAGNFFAISCSMPSTSSWTLTNFSIAARVFRVCVGCKEFCSSYNSILPGPKGTALISGGVNVKLVGGFFGSTVARCHQRASAYISAHQQSSEDTQKHSNDTPKYVQSTSEDTSREATFFS